MATISVLFIDSNAVFLRLVTSVLRHYHQDEVEVVGAVGGYDEALALQLDVHPQIVLLGLGSSGLSNLAIIPRLRHSLPHIGVIVLGLVDARGYPELVYAAGADAFVLKASMSTDLLPTIRRVAQARQRAGESATPRAWDEQKHSVANEAASYTDTDTISDGTGAQS